jgi:transposase
MRVGLIGQVRRVWAPRGVKVEQAVEHKYEWAYLNLAVNGLTGELHWDWTENMKSESIAPVVKSWEEEVGVQVLVWDGARGHHGSAYEEIQVERINQPAYSPQLNPAERIFEYLRDRIEGKVYGTIAAKKLAVEAELEKLAKAPARIKSLAGWNWIRESVSRLPELNMALS